MKIFIKRLLPIFTLLLVGLGIWDYQSFWQHKWYAEKRIFLMFEALKNGNYEMALKHWDPTGKRSINSLKEFLENGRITKVKNFEIVDTEVDGFKDDLWMRVYVKINNQKSPPIAFLVEYNRWVLYSGHNSYL